ncbi:MAG: aromatic ring-hydroxylating dioxygenase subunit alpha, partial [Acidimicrobiia bacterium]
MTQVDPAPAPVTRTGAFVHEDPDRQVFLVHRDVLRSPEVFEAERRALWERSWLYLGHASELPSPGDFKTRTLAGRPLIFCRTSAGEIAVYHNSCPHKGTVLCRESSGSSRFFRCFYHAWTFDNEGTLVSLPGEDAYGSRAELRERMHLRPVARLGVHRGFVFVSFTTEVPSLAEHLGAAADYLDLVADQCDLGLEAVPGTHLYGVRANWKLAVENALDAYHFGPTHITFIDYRKTTGYITSSTPGIPKTLGNGHFVHIAQGRYGRAGLDWEPSWGEAERTRIEANRAELVARLGEERAAAVADTSRILYVFPNLLLFDILGISVRQLEPTAPDYTDVNVWQLAPVGEPEEARALRLDHLLTFIGPGGFSSPDDMEAYEAIQRGVRSTAGDDRGEVDWSDVSRGMEKEQLGLQPDT